MKLSERLYRLAPVPLQHLMVSLYGGYWHWARFGPGYQEELDGYKERERFDGTQWQEWLQARLQLVLRVAANEVPFYSERWTSAQKEAAYNGDLRQLPILDKEPLRQNPLLFVRRGRRPLGTQVYYTSGSTGTPLAVHWTLREHRSALALREARSANWAGVSFSMPRATFSGRIVEPNPDSKGPFYRFNFVERQVYFSAFHLRPGTAPSYVRALWRHGVQWLTGYAVSWYLLASMILDQGLEVPPLKAVVTTSEKVTPEMRAAMEKAYRCPVFEEYSTVENVVFASECEHHRLHVSPDAGIVEILREDGSPCAPGEPGQVVATCLLRTYQPFVRFRLGDLAKWAPDPCPCGRAMPVIEEVVGRLEDVVVGPDGRRMVRFHGLYLGLPGIRRGQVVQEAIDRITVRIENAPGFERWVAEEIATRVRQRLGPDVKVCVETVEHIPPGPNGKFQAVVSGLPRQ